MSKFLGSLLVPNSITGLKVWIENKKYDGTIPANSGYRICMSASCGDYIEMDLKEFNQIADFVKETFNDR